MVEELLKQILAGQEMMGKQINTLIQDVNTIKQDTQSLKSDVQDLKENVQGLNQDVQRLNENVQDIKVDVQTLKEGVQRIELHQEDTIMSMLTHIKKQVEMKESQIQVLNKRLFDVETKTEHFQQ